MHFDPKSRRLFLKGAGGILLSIPLLPSLLERFVGEAMSYELGNDVQAFIFARTYYGILNSYTYLYDQTGWTIAQNEPIVRIKSLKSIQNNYVNDFLETKLHDLGLTEFATIPHGNTGFNVADHVQTSVLCACKQTEGEDGHPIVKQSSIDVLLEKSPKVHKNDPKLKALRVRPGGKTGSHSRSFSFELQSDGTFIKNTFEDNPMNIYNLFFASQQIETSNFNSLKKAAIDNVLEDYKRMRNLASSEDRQKLEQYADTINSVSQTIDIDNGSSPLCSNPETPSEIDPSEISKSYKDMNTLITQAIACGLTKVVCIDLPHYQESGSSASSYHGTSHGGRDGKDTATASHLRGLKFSRDQIFDLAVKMKNTLGTNGKNLLDNSVILHTSDMSWAHGTDGGNAIMILGKGNGKLNSGNIFDYRVLDSQGRYRYRVGGGGGYSEYFGAMGWCPYGCLLETFLQMGGLERSEYLLPNQLCFGSLTLYSYNLEDMKKFHTRTYLSGPPPFLLRS